MDFTNEYIINFKNVHRIQLKLLICAQIHEWDRREITPYPVPTVLVCVIILLQYFCPFFQNYGKGKQFYNINAGSSHILQCLKKMNTQTYYIYINRKNISRLDEPHGMLH